MGEPLYRNVGQQFRVGDEDVVITMHEYYDGENPVPTILRVTSSNGFVTKTWAEMLDLLGIPHPQPPSAQPEADPPPSAEVAETSQPAAVQEASTDVSHNGSFASASGDKSLDDTESEAGCCFSTSRDLQSEDPLQLLGWYPGIRGTYKERSVRVGNKDVTIREYEQPASDRYRLPARRWFEAPNGIKTRGYYQMLDALGGRPTPLLPEDEDRFLAQINTSSNSADRKPPREDREPIANLGASPFSEKDPRQLSETELDMRMIWWAEYLRQSQPDLYEAAIDSVKREAYVDNLTGQERLTKEEQTAIDTAPRCRFIKMDGESCGAFALKNNRFCYFHLRTSDGRKRKRRTKALSIPVLEDDLAVKMTVTQICRGLANESIDTKRASVLLYGLQVATAALRRIKQPANAAKEESCRE